MDQYDRFLNTRGTRVIPGPTQFMEEITYMNMLNQSMLKSGIKLKSCCQIKHVASFFTKLINQSYFLDPEKALMFEDSLLLYSELICDPNMQEKQFKKFLSYLNARYRFVVNPQNLGFLIGNMILCRIRYEDNESQINKIIQKIYVFSDKDRSYCDFSKVLFYQISSIMQRLLEQIDSYGTYLNWQLFEIVQYYFDYYYNDTQSYFRSIWQQFGMSESNHEHQLARLLDRVSDFKTFQHQDRQKQFYSIIFLLKFIIHQHHNNHQFSAQLIATIHHLINKLCYLPLNKQFCHMNAFLILYKLIMEKKNLFDKVKQRLYLSLKAALLFYQQNPVANDGIQIINEFIQRAEQLVYDVEIPNDMSDTLSLLATLTRIKQNQSQLLSYGSPSLINERRNSSYLQISKVISQQGKNKKYLHGFQIGINVRIHQSQILKYAQQRIGRQQYLDLYLTLQEIYSIFQNKVQLICQEINDIGQRHKHVKCLYTWYAASYMRILKSLNSNQNKIFQEKYMSTHFIQQCFVQIINRFAELGMVDVDYRQIYDILFENYTLGSVLIFDIQLQRFGVRQIMDKLKNLDGLTGSFISMYELDMIKKYSNHYVSNYSANNVARYNDKNRVNNKQIKNEKQDMKQQSKRFIGRLLQRKQKLMNTRLDEQVRIDRLKQKLKQKAQKDKQSKQYEHRITFEQNLTYLPIKLQSHNFIKSQIFRLLQKYIQYNRILQNTERRGYYQIFCSIVIVLDNQQLLLDIYANIIYTLLTNSSNKLVRQTYYALSTVRDLFSQKFRFSFKQGDITTKGILCIYQKLRIIQIKRNRVIKYNNSASSNVTSPSGKSKYCQVLLSQQSKVYKQYFQQLLHSPLQKIITYGRQLHLLNKHKQAIFILQNSIQQLNTHFQRLDQDKWDQRQLGSAQQRIQLSKLMLTCYTVLSDSYAALVPEFRNYQQYTNKKYIDKLLKGKLIKDYQRNKKIEKQKLLLPAQPSILQRICTQLSGSYLRFDNSIKVQKERGQIDFLKVVKNQPQFKRRLYLQLAEYSRQKLKNIRNKDDFQQFYLTMVISGIVIKYYQQKTMQILTKIKQNQLKRKSQGGWQLQEQKKKMSQNKKNKDIQQKIKQQNVFIPSYEQILRKYFPLLKSKQDQHYIIELLKVVQYKTEVKNIQTIRMYNKSLLQSDQIWKIYKLAQDYSDKQQLSYEYIGLLQLQILQRYEFERQGYQRAKLIAGDMKVQRQLKSYGQAFQHYVNWPQVLGYELMGKIYDQNTSSDLSIQRRFNQMNNMISQDTYCIVEQKKYLIQKMKDIKYINDLKRLTPKKYHKLVNQMQIKIQQYFSLIRIIFDRIELIRASGLLIFQILFNISTKFLNPHMIRQQILVDFFFYYVRFLCQKVNCQWFGSGLHQKLSTQNFDKYIKNKKSQIIAFLKKNIHIVKNHKLYMIRSLDPQVKTQKNSILTQILVQMLVANPAQHAWTLTFLKNYQMKLPYRRKNPSAIKNISQPQEKKRISKKFPQRPEYEYGEDQQINTQYDESIYNLYTQVLNKLLEKKYDAVIQVPQTLLSWLQRMAVDISNQVDKKIDIKSYYFVIRSNIEKQMKEINQKIRRCRWRIPFPFDNKLYIKCVTSIDMVLNGAKSQPCFVFFKCGNFSQLKVPNVWDRSSQQFNDMNTADVDKQILLKNNFTKQDHRIQTNSANFYKQIGILDADTTYGIINLTKYILAIQKITVGHVSLRQFFTKNLSIDEHMIYKKKQQFYDKIITQYLPDKNRNYRRLIDPLWVDQYKRIQSSQQPMYNPSLMQQFYHRGLKKMQNIEEWWRYIHNYIRTLAQWSYLCYVTQLGDRHLTNILISHTGKFIHIDYQYNFGHGLSLPCPQWVPFRFTDLIVSPLGVFKQKGIFFAYFVSLAKKFNTSQYNVWKSLVHFSPSQRKLIKNTSQFSSYSIPKTIQQNCELIIELAQDKSLLRKMFLGWSPQI